MKYLDLQTRKKLQRYYNLLQIQTARKHQHRLNTLYKAYPQLKEFEKQKIDLQMRIIKAQISGRVQAAALQTELERLNAEFQAYLSQHQIPLDYEKIQYQCPDCEDTGWVDQDYCHCVDQVLLRLNIQNAVFLPPQNKNFEAFDASYFSAEKNVHFFQGKISPREAIVGIKKLMLDFIEHFSDAPKSLYLFGAPGTGKTFMMACIANALLKTGKQVVYLKAVRLFEIMAKRNVLLNSFQPDPEEQDRIKQELDSIYHADLLCIDDLGMEANAFKNTYADFIIMLDERLDRGLSTMITSNLRPKDLGDEYDERIRSRITGEFDLIMFEGEDIRNRIAGIESNLRVENQRK